MRLTMTENKTVEQLADEYASKYNDRFAPAALANMPFTLSEDGFKAGYAARDDEVQTKITKLEQALGWKEIDRKGTKSYEIMKHSQAFMEELVTMMKEENKRIEQALAVAEELLIKIDNDPEGTACTAGEALEKIKAIKEGK